MCGTNAVAWASAASASKLGLPSWPAIAFGAIAVIGVYGTIAPLARIWPFRALRAPKEVLDEQIRLAREARERIVRLGLSDEASQVEYLRWFFGASVALERYVPAIADEFLLADADDTAFSGQALLVQVINSKLRVLQRGRGEP